MSGKGLARYLLLTRFQPLPIGTFQLHTLRQEKPGRGGNGNIETAHTVPEGSTPSWERLTTT
jgi:hypothetical protein